MQHVRITLAASSLDPTIRFHETLTGLSEPERDSDLWKRLQLDNVELWLMPSATAPASGGAVGLDLAGVGAST